MSETAFEKAILIGRIVRLRDVRGLIMVAFLCVLVSLALTKSASAATLFTNPAQVTIPEGELHHHTRRRSP